MSDVSAIEWTDASWNPVTGCTKVSPGCAHCYAERFAERLRGTKAFPQGFDLVLHPERLTLPIKWKRPRRIFVNSMSALFHEAVPFDFVDAVFDTMQRADQHIYQILTKRPERLLIWSRERRVKFPEHIWVGASVENQRWARRIDDLAQVDAAVRFLSCEPILKQLDLTAYLHSGGISWVILGGESGRRARPMEVQWARAIRDQCLVASVPFFFKQWGGMTSKSGGRLLDGRIWDQMPSAVNHIVPGRRDTKAA